jgi:SAM-dependent methyltransferase
MVDPGTFRVESRASWEDAAHGWAARADAFSRDTLPVSQWLVEHVDPQPGHHVLDLAAGTGDTGLLAAEMVLPGGRVLITDGAEAMVETARVRAVRRGVENVEIRAMEAEWIDIGAALLDSVVCRWGYMLLADPEAALRETRRVLRPGGRLALAAWDAPDSNPWMALSGRLVVERGLQEPADPGAPGPFAFAAPGHIEELLEVTGFHDIEVNAVDFTFTAPDLDGWWDHLSQTSPTLRRTVPGLNPADHYALRDAIDAAYAPFVGPDGSVSIPARTLVAAASA